MRLLICRAAAPKGTWSELLPDAPYTLPHRPGGARLCQRLKAHPPPTSTPRVCRFGKAPCVPQFSAARSASKWQRQLEENEAGQRPRPTSLPAFRACARTAAAELSPRAPAPGGSHAPAHLAAFPGTGWIPGAGC